MVKNGIILPKKIALFYKITSKHDGDFYCLNCLLLLELYRNAWRKLKTLKYNHGEKSIKIPFLIHVGMESLLKNRYMS